MMGWILLIAVVPVGILVWRLWLRQRWLDRANERDDHVCDDHVWDRVVSEASRENLVFTAINQGINNAELMDNHTLIRLLQGELNRR